MRNAGKPRGEFRTDPRKVMGKMNLVGTVKFIGMGRWMIRGKVANALISLGKFCFSQAGRLLGVLAVKIDLTFVVAEDGIINGLEFVDKAGGEGGPEEQGAGSSDGD